MNKSDKREELILKSLISIGLAIIGGTILVYGSNVLVLIGLVVLIWANNINRQ